MNFAVPGYPADSPFCRDWRDCRMFGLLTDQSELNQLNQDCSCWNWSWDFVWSVGAWATASWCRLIMTGTRTACITICFLFSGLRRLWNLWLSVQAFHFFVFVSADWSWFVASRSVADPCSEMTEVGQRRFQLPIRCTNAEQWHPLTMPQSHHLYWVIYSCQQYAEGLRLTYGISKRLWAFHYRLCTGSTLTSKPFPWWRPGGFGLA